MWRGHLGTNIWQKFVFVFLIFSFQNLSATNFNYAFFNFRNNIPIGAVLPFDAASCPVNWTEFSAAKGRILVSAGTGNTDADGTALTSRTAGVSGGREYTTGIPATTLAANTSNPSGNTLAAASIYLSCTANTTLDGVKADSNMAPFVSRLFCKKTSASRDIPADLSVSFSLAVCPVSGWTADSARAGRFTLGAGTGNTDADGAALTSRTLNATGGREYTTGIPACTGSRDVGATPGPTVNLATAVGMGVMTYGSDSPDDYIAGVKANSNMPPFIALTACKPSSATVKVVPAGAVMAFDLPSCPTGWTSYTQGSGRAILGAGTGNTDADGAPLTSRSFNETGGREFTTGLHTSVLDATDTTPGSSIFLAASVGIGMYRNASADTTVGGAKADSNLSPFYTLLHCIKQ